MMSLLRIGAAVWLVVIQVGMAHAQDAERLFSNWVNLCNSGRELHGAGSIGEIILNCPDDDIEAKAAKSQIKSLAMEICRDANNSCSIDATRIFNGMQCELLLSLVRSEKCGRSESNQLSSGSSSGTERNATTAAQIASVRVSVIDDIQSKKSSSITSELAGKNSTNGELPSCNPGFAYCSSTLTCCRIGTPCSSDKELCQVPAPQSGSGYSGGYEKAGTSSSKSNRIRTDSADSCLKTKEHRSPSMLCTPWMWCWTDLWNTCKDKDDEIVVYYTTQLNKSFKKMKMALGPKSNGSINADFPDSPQIKGACFTQNPYCRSSFEQAGYP